MNRIIFFLVVIVLLVGILSPQVHADTVQTTQDERAGKAVWDKLQSKQVTCKDLKDDDFDVLGDFFMGNMMGGSHDSMNQKMAQRLGDDREKQMHIAMGKRLSGCDVLPMMGYGYGGMMGHSFGIVGSLTWIVVLVFLTLGSIYFWKEIQKKK